MGVGLGLGQVLATGTLAFGINMPCRTTVFALDSKQLTPILYRQMSGRAGRRGYDDVGNVVFFGVPPQRAAQLMTTKLPSLQGQIPSSTALSLRLLSLHKLLSVEDSLPLEKSLTVMLTRPLAGFATDAAAAARVTRLLTHHFRFSVNFLLQQHFVYVDEMGGDGGGVGWCGGG
jgi:replicative superfamily II helicase